MPHKESRSIGKYKLVNYFKFNKNTEEMNSMATSAAPKKKG